MFKKNPQPQPSPALEESVSSTDLVSRRAKLEDERMSRRQALRKMGILSGVAVLALVSVDDLARLAAKQLAAHSGDSEVAGSVAKSLRSAGVAFADPYGTFDPNDEYFPTDCESRCLQAAANHLANNVPAQNQSSAIGVIEYCRAHNIGDSDGLNNCVITGLLHSQLSDPWISTQTYPFLDCCNGLCLKRQEGAGSCIDEYAPVSPPTPGYIPPAPIPPAPTPIPV